MKPTTHFALAVMIVCTAFVLSGCDNSSSSNRGEQPADPLRSVSGTLTAPNGTTPISGATVYIEGTTALSAARVFATQFDDSCSPPPVESLYWTCTKPDGSFTLNFAAAPGTLTVQAVRGQWSTAFNVEVPVAEDEEIQQATVSFPNDPEEGAPRIAVITGWYDQIENVLIKLGMTTDPDLIAEPNPTIDPDQYPLSVQSVSIPRSGSVSIEEIDRQHRLAHFGQHLHQADFQTAQSLPWLGTETFHLYIGSRIYPGDYPNMNLLFSPNDDTGQANLFSYDILYINCDAPLPSDGNWVSLVQQFVEGGGVLYVTDLSSPFVATAFSSIVSRDYNAYEVDTGASVTVVNQAMRSWLDSVHCNSGEACLDDEGAFNLSGFGAHVLQPQNDDDVVTAHVTRPAIAEGASDMLTLSFPVGNNGGVVIFSTYHTSTGFSSHYTPDERVLEFLFYEEVQQQ